LQIGRQRVAPSHILRLQLGQHSDGVVPSPRAAEPAPAKAGGGRPADVCGSPARRSHARRGSGPGVRRRSWRSGQSACAARVHSCRWRREPAHRWRVFVSRVMVRDPAGGGGVVGGAGGCHASRCIIRGAALGRRVCGPVGRRRRRPWQWPFGERRVEPVATAGGERAGQSERMSVGSPAPAARSAASPCPCCSQSRSWIWRA
jgi:hypothetical protein